MKIFADAGRGGHFSFVANMAVLVAIACTAVAMLLDGATRGPDAPLTALLAPNGSRPQMAAIGAGRPVPLREAIVPQFDGVDTTPTASISRPIMLNPCLERQR